LQCLQDFTDLRELGLRIHHMAGQLQQGGGFPSGFLAVDGAQLVLGLRAPKGRLV
jgi:hypothetical protein